MRKLSFLLLLMMLCLSASPVRADTEGDFAFSVKNGRATLTAYTGSADHLTVPDTLGGYPVTSISYCAFRDCAALLSVALPGSVTTIGSNAFENCASLSQIILPDSLAYIGTHAFYGCVSLEQIAFPESLKRLHPYAFYGCSADRLCGLQSRAALVLTDYGYSFISPDYPQLSLTAHENAEGIRTFTVTNCEESAVSVSFPDGVTLIDGYAFFNCASLTEIILPEGIAEIAYSAFEGCVSLKEITIPASVVRIAGDAFARCQSVTLIAPEGSAGLAFAQKYGYAWRALQH